MQKFETQPHAHLQPLLWNGRLSLGKFVLTLSLNRKPEPGPALLANRLEVLRRERSLARQELADQLSIHLSTLVALEQGRYQPSLGLALRLSEFFNLPVEAIFSRTTERFV